MHVLNNEPRFLSITPDTGLLDLTASALSDANANDAAAASYQTVIQFMHYSTTGQE